MTLIRGTLPALAEHAVMSCVPIAGLATLPLLCCLLQARHPTQLLLCAALAVPCVWDLQAHLHTPSTRVSLHMCLFEPSFCDPNASKLVCACCCVAAAIVCCASCAGICLASVLRLMCYVACCRACMSPQLAIKECLMHLLCQVLARKLKCLCVHAVVCCSTTLLCLGLQITREFAVAFTATGVSSARMCICTHALWLCLGGG